MQELHSMYHKSPPLDDIKNADITFTYKQSPKGRL